MRGGHELNGIKEIIEKSLGEKKAQLVLKNAFIINVFTGSIEKGDIAIEGENIIGIGDYSGYEEYDCTGIFAAPGFIDSHVHIESSFVTPDAFSNILIKHGVTTAIADPHEIANVLGVNGIDMMINNSKDSLGDIFYMVPSCVPATEFEDNGFTILAEDMKKYLLNERVIGLGEVMDVPSVINRKEEMLDKIAIFKDKNLDGHCPKISEKWLNAYICCGINTDHECSSVAEARKKLQKGMYVMIREGSAAKNLDDLIGTINDFNFHRFLFCTDDRHLKDLIEEGSIDYIVRRAIAKGLDPIKAITIASYNPCICYNLKKRGAICPGYLADIVLFNDINKITIDKVIKKGKICSKHRTDNPMEYANSINMPHIDEDMLKVSSNDENINVIRLKHKSIETDKHKVRAKLKNGYIEGFYEEDILKICVFERHKKTGRYGIGYIEGFGLNGCSIAQSIAHDSHNIIAISDNSKDMVIAVNKLIDIGGGIVIVSKGEVLQYVDLPVGGIMSNDEPMVIYEKAKKMYEILSEFGMKKDNDPFLTLGFMALPVIPKLKITTRGYFDYDTFNFISLS